MPAKLIHALEVVLAVYKIRLRGKALITVCAVLMDQKEVIFME